MNLVDARGNVVALDRSPRRIVSLVPSDTYSLVALGALARLVGRTEYCVEPSQELASVPKLGGTKNPNLSRIVELRPELVFANKEENSPRDVFALERAGIPVYVSFPKTLTEGASHLSTLCGILEASSTACELVHICEQAVFEARTYRAHCKTVRVFAPIWLDPLMTFNGDTFMSDALGLAGGVNVFATRLRRYPLAADVNCSAFEEVAGECLLPAADGDTHQPSSETRDTRYPRVSLEELERAEPELVLLPDEPYAFGVADAQMFGSLPIPAATRSAIVHINGKDLSWYGLRAIEAIPRVRELVQRWCFSLPVSYRA